MTTSLTWRRSPVRNRRGLMVLGTLGLAGIVGLSSGCSATSAATVSESKSFGPPPSDRLVIASDHDLTVRTHSGDAIEVERRVPEGWDSSWSLRGDTLELRVEQPSVNLGVGADGEVLVPEGLAVEVRMPNADLDVSDVTDGLTVHKTNGDVRLTDVTGSVEVTMTNGDIDMDASEPPDEVRLRTKNGDTDVRLGGNQAYAVSADTVNGDVEIGVQRREGADRTIDASSTNGDITIDRR